MVFVSLLVCVSGVAVYNCEVSGLDLVIKVEGMESTLFFLDGWAGVPMVVTA